MLDIMSFSLFFWVKECITMLKCNGKYQQKNSGCCSSEKLANIRLAGLRGLGYKYLLVGNIVRCLDIG